MFKAESGTKNPEDRIIPLLPGKEIFRNKTVAMKRIEPINDYCEVNQIAFLKNYETLNPIFFHNLRN